MARRILEHVQFGAASACVAANQAFVCLPCLPNYCAMLERASLLKLQVSCSPLSGWVDPLRGKVLSVAALSPLCMATTSGTQQPTKMRGKKNGIYGPP